MAKKKRNKSDDEPWPLLERIPKVGDLLFKFSFSEPKFGSTVLVLEVQFVNKNHHEDCYHVKCWHLKTEKIIGIYVEKDTSSKHFPYYALVSEL